MRHKFALQLLLFSSFLFDTSSADEIRDLQTSAVQQGNASWGHWGTNPKKYSSWISHSNRLIPIYTFGMTLGKVKDGASVYRDAKRLEALYGRVPDGTLNPNANYFDQTDVYHLQKLSADAGKKNIVLFVFDGMDWQTTQAAAVFRSGKAYRDGRGEGLHFQDYRGTATDYGYFVSSPHNKGTTPDADAQIVTNIGGTSRGGYDWKLGGETPWSKPRDPDYLLGRNRERAHVVTDSASAATSMTAGIKTYYWAINVDADGRQVVPIARTLQQEKGFSVGIVSSVPISHATPACAYANNVNRNDLQDLTRDLLGLPSIAHRESALSGVDVLLGGGWGNESKSDSKQGRNFVPGNKYITAVDLARIDVANGGKYEVALRTTNQSGGEVLSQAAHRSVKNKKRLFGFFGVGKGNLPFQTADGKFDPTIDASVQQKYTSADVKENPTLAQMTRAALTVLETNPQGFWLMVEAGDVDWANHSNNVDNSIGAVLSGDDAFREVTRWAEENKCWDDTVVILTADHGHFLVLREPERLIEKN